ncbi:MAG: dTDP-glucose 4,6-dehydratase [Candidatus Sumerlaeia bacterium]
MKRVLVTGGCGFIGSNFARYMLREHPDYEIIVLDKLTYAGNPENIADLKDHPRFSFVRGDICDAALMNEWAGRVDWIVNFAAETHVDRSISQPDAFIRTDIFGTYTILEAVKSHPNVERFLQISTDEVYGSIEKGSFGEDSPLRPSSPYASSKAGGDLMCLAYWTTFRTPVLITRSSNNYGPYQYPEKLIPLFITNLLEDQPVPVYGDGLNVRDWLYVEDNCAGIDLVLHEGRLGEIYNIGAGEEKTNLEITHLLLDILERPRSLIRYVEDRKGHDRRYSVACDKVRALGWAPAADFEQSLRRTVEWYRQNRAWWEKIKSGEFRDYYRAHYKDLFAQ